MAVEPRFAVVRNNEEIKVMVTKKEADEYDKVLDIADIVAENLSASGKFEHLDEKDIENLGLFIAVNKDNLSATFKGKPWDDSITFNLDKNSGETPTENHAEVVEISDKKEKIA